MAIIELVQGDVETVTKTDDVVKKTGKTMETITTKDLVKEETKKEKKIEVKVEEVVEEVVEKIEEVVEEVKEVVEEVVEEVKVEGAADETNGEEK